MKVWVVMQIKEDLGSRSQVVVSIHATKAHAERELWDRARRRLDETQFHDEWVDEWEVKGVGVAP